MTETFTRSIREELASWEAAGLLRSLEAPDGRDFTSNDYLGLSQDSRVIQAAKAALETWGAGAPAARLLRGNLPPHREAEQEAAAWLGCEAALLFPSGWQANLAVLSTLVNKGDLLFSDQLNHASLIDGCRLSAAHTSIFKHHDLDDLNRQLASAPTKGQRWIVLERTWSMEGDHPPLEEIADLAQHHNALIHLDEAHAAGLVNPALPQDWPIATRMFTGGKSLGVSGAFVCANQETIDLLINRARAFVFTTAPTPATAAALAEAIRIIQKEPERGKKALRAAKTLRSKLAKGGVKSGGESPIVPVILGSEERALAVAQAIRKQGMDVRAIRPPTVPVGTSRLRIVCHADHSEEDIDGLATSILEAVKMFPTTENEPAKPAPQNQPWVVCGTDTDVGKTVVSAILVRQSIRNGESPSYIKPVQTGPDSDTQTVLQLAEPESAPPPILSLPLPASVDQAAKDAGVKVEARAIYEGVLKNLTGAPERRWVVECAGGMLVPFSGQEDQSDFLALLGAPLFLVARSGLGTLNHTLLTLEAAKRRNLEVRLLFLVGELHQANLESLQSRNPQLPIVQVPLLPDLNKKTLDAWLEENPLPSLQAQIG